MYTEEEKQLAKSIVNNKPLMEFLWKVMIATPQKMSPEMRRIMIEKTNEERGHLSLAELLADEKVEERFNNLKIIGTESSKNKTPIAPS